MLCFLYTLFLQYHSSSPISSRLELLPNELLLDILSYLSISDLFYGWLNLNWRFNIILHSVPITKCYNGSEGSCWYSWQNPSDAEPLRYFAPQLVSLQTHKHLSPSVANEIEIFDYPNLRRLTLHRPTPTQFDVIREQNFHHLQYLSLAKTRNFSFEVLCQFKSLRSCELMSLTIDGQCSCSSSSIQSLILHRCEPSSLLHFLRHLPQLNFFKMNIFCRNVLIDKPDSTTVFVHPNLMTLKISMIDFDFSNTETNADKCDVITALMNHVSPYTRIRCHLGLFELSNFNFEQLQRHVFKLNFFRFSCHFFHILKLHPLPNFDHIQQLPLFNRFELIDNVSDVVLVYESTWTNPYRTFLK